MLADKMCFLGDSGGLLFSSAFGKKAKKVPNFFRKFSEGPPKIDFTCIFGPLFFKILENCESPSRVNVPYRPWRSKGPFVEREAAKFLLYLVLTGPKKVFAGPSAPLKPIHSYI